MEEKEKKMHEMLKEKAEEKLKIELKTGIAPDNVEYIYKLTDILKDAGEIKEKEESNMYRDYGEYGDNYGRRGVPGTGRGRYRRYRGEDALDEMKYHYGNYMDSYNTGNYNGKEDSSYKMTEALEKFIFAVNEELEPKDKQMFKQTMQEMVHKM